MASFKHKVGLGIRVPRQLVYRYFFYDNWSTDNLVYRHLVYYHQCSL